MLSEIQWRVILLLAVSGCALTATNLSGLFDSIAMGTELEMTHHHHQHDQQVELILARLHMVMLPSSSVIREKVCLMKL